MTAPVVLIRYTRPNIWRCRNVRLVPGINEVGAGDWREVEDHPLLQDRIKAGDIEVVRAGTGEKLEETQRHEANPSKDLGDNQEMTLARYNVAECRELIAETYDPELLKKWLGVEKRRTVVSLLEDQIKRIEVQKEKGEEE